MKWRKKPVVIEAVRFEVDANGTPLHAWPLDWPHPQPSCASATSPLQYITNELFVKTVEGLMHVTPGDWIICGVQGEFYPCKPDIFAATYEDAAQPPPDSELASDSSALEKALGALRECREVLGWVDGVAPETCISEVKMYREGRPTLWLQDAAFKAGEAADLVLSGGAHVDGPKASRDGVSHRGVAAYLLDRADQYETNEPEWIALADVAQNIMRGEVAAAERNGDFDAELYARVDSMAPLPQPGPGDRAEKEGEG